MSSSKGLSRRQFLRRSLTGAAAFSVVSRHILGGPGYEPPSNVLTRAVIGTGGRGGAFCHGHMLAACDVDTRRFRGPKEAKRYTDFRRVMDRNDIDVVYIATPPHWHALICIHAAQAGKDIYCEKPMTKFIHEGRKVVEAVNRYGRIFQIGTFGRFGANRTTRKLMASGLLSPEKLKTIRYHRRGGFKVRRWSGRTDLTPQPVPPNLDYNMWLGPAPYKPYHPHRVHGSFRGYWDYDGGGLADMGQHHLDGFQYAFNKDETSPVEIKACAPFPPHSDACGMWGWVEMKYEDGVTLVLESGEWGEAYEGPGSRSPSESDLTPEQREALDNFPDPEPMIGRGQGGFEEAVRQRKQCGGHAEAAHRCAALLHLTNIAIRLGRRLRYEPVEERFIGDEHANRLVNIPMRAPWHL